MAPSAEPQPVGMKRTFAKQEPQMTSDLPGHALSLSLLPMSWPKPISVTVITLGLQQTPHMLPVKPFLPLKLHDALDNFSGCNHSARLLTSSFELEWWRSRGAFATGLHVKDLDEEKRHLCRSNSELLLRSRTTFPCLKLYASHLPTFKFRLFCRLLEYLWTFSSKI